MQSADPYFRLDANLCAAIPRIINRADGLHPRTDLWTLLALHAYADSVPAWRRIFSDDAAGLPTLRVPYRPSAVLETLGHRRDRPGRTDFSSDTWRTLRSSVRRLALATVSIPYTVLDGDRRGPAATRRLAYDGPPVTVEEDETGGRRVCLPVAGGLTTGFFVSIGRAVFDLRAELSEIDARVLVWLLRQHRGRTRTHRRRRVICHQTVLELDPSDVAAQLGLHAGHPGRGRAAVMVALGRLESLDVLGVEERREPRLVVELVGSVFRGEGD